MLLFSSYRVCICGFISHAIPIEWLRLKVNFLTFNPNHLIKNHSKIQKAKSEIFLKIWKEKLNCTHAILFEYYMGYESCICWRIDVCCLLLIKEPVKVNRADCLFVLLPYQLVKVHMFIYTNLHKRWVQEEITTVVIYHSNSNKNKLLLYR